MRTEGGRVEDRETFWYATWEERCDLLFADARERGWTPCELRVPRELVEWWERVTGAPYTMERGIPVVPRDRSRVMLVCEAGTVSFELLAWDWKER